MKTQLRVDIEVIEREVQPPWYAADPDNPTEEEELENEASFKEWEAAGGFDQRKLRCVLTAGPRSDWSGPSLESLSLKMRSIESPIFHKGNTDARASAEKCTCDIIGHLIGRYLLDGSKPEPEPDPPTRTCPECGGRMDFTPYKSVENLSMWKCPCGLNMAERLIIGPGVKHLLKPEP